jgi:hypothetical protein
VSSESRVLVKYNGKYHAVRWSNLPQVVLLHGLDRATPLKGYPFRLSVGQAKEEALKYQISANSYITELARGWATSCGDLASMACLVKRKPVSDGYSIEFQAFIES